MMSLKEAEDNYQNALTALANAKTRGQYITAKYVVDVRIKQVAAAREREINSSKNQGGGENSENDT